MSAVLREPAEVIAPMLMHEVPEVLVIEQAVYEFPWTQGNFVDSLRAGHSAWNMSDWGGGLMAYAVMMIGAEEAHLLNLSIAAPFQRRGYWRLLLEHLVKVARGYGAGVMLLEVRPPNEAPRRLYLAFGFALVGGRRRCCRCRTASSSFDG